MCYSITCIGLKCWHREVEKLDEEVLTLLVENTALTDVRSDGSYASFAMGLGSWVDPQVFSQHQHA